MCFNLPTNWVYQTHYQLSTVTQILFNISRPKKKVLNLGTKLSISFEVINEYAKNKT